MNPFYFFSPSIKIYNKLTTPVALVDTLSLLARKYGIIATNQYWNYKKCLDRPYSFNKQKRWEILDLFKDLIDKEENGLDLRLLKHNDFNASPFKLVNMLFTVYLMIIKGLII